MKIRILSIFTLLFTIIGGCGEDFLEKAPLAEVTEGAFPSTPEDALLATNASYNSLRAWNLQAGGFPILDIASDEATKGSAPGDGTATAVFEDFSYDAFDPAMERWYKALYEAIRRTNLVIDEVPKISMDTDLQNRLVAEARFLRGYYYSVLVRAFGAVPYVLDVSPALDLGRTDAAVLWQDLILPDLEFAAANLPEKSEYPDEDLGRVTKGAAKSLLARLHLYLGNYSEARDYALEVINSGQYDLETDFADAFSAENEGGIESVWEVPALPFGFGDGGNQYANTWAIRGTPNRGWGFGRPAYSWIEKLVANDDPRLDASVIFIGESLNGVETEGSSDAPDTVYNENNQIVEIECYNQKVWHPGPGTVESFGHNRRLIRYADVLLMAAEALNETGDPGNALNYLNQVRARARGGDNSILPDITITNQSDLRLAIENERHYELALEGHRFWDLIRTDRAADFLGPLGFVEGKHELFPIPQSEVDITEGRVTQNPNY